MKHLKIPDEVHKPYKLWCVKNDVDIQKKTTELITKFLLEEAGGVHE